MKTLFITGGSGFIGSSLVRILMQEMNYNIINIDKYDNTCHQQLGLTPLNKNYYTYVNSDMKDLSKIEELFNKYQPIGIIHLAAESNVDVSINQPCTAIQNNILSTYCLLEASKRYYQKQTNNNLFKFLYVSTYEVYGNLDENAADLFNEYSAYNPRNPYAASKASCEMLVLSWFHTYGLPILISNCSNNYGEYQFGNKLIPSIIYNALHNKPLTIYGKGNNLRDWLYVNDHANAIIKIFEDGLIGERYCIGGGNQITNIELVNNICDLLDLYKPQKNKQSYKNQIIHVTDRRTHDLRHAICYNKIIESLGWNVSVTFEIGLEKTVKWYLNNLYSKK